MGDFRVVLRDLANVPEPNDNVTVEFVDSPDARFSTDQSPMASADCPDHEVISSQFSGMDGVVTMRIVGHADHNIAPNSEGHVRVWAAEVVMANLPVAYLDLDGGGLGASDLSVWLGDFFSGQPYARSDYNGDGVLSAADLSIWVTAFFAAGSAQAGSAPNCP
jgi:hypothetical protein